MVSLRVCVTFAHTQSSRAMPDLEDVNAMAVPVLSHRVVVNFQAEAEGMSPEKLVTVPDRP